MDGIPSELAIAGVIGALLLAAVILIKFGKQILTALLVVAGIAVVGVIVWVVLSRPDVIPDDAASTISDVADIARVIAPKSEPEPVYVAPAQGGGGGFIAGLLTAAVVAALGVGGYFYARWKLAERGHRQRRPECQDAQVIYLVGGPDDDDIYDDDSLDWEDEWIGEPFQL
jgi:hypothetical protein